MIMLFLLIFGLKSVISGQGAPVQLGIGPKQYIPIQLLVPKPNGKAANG